MDLTIEAADRYLKEMLLRMLVPFVIGVFLAVGAPSGNAPSELGVRSAEAKPRPKKKTRRTKTRRRRPTPPPADPAPEVAEPAPVAPLPSRGPTRIDFDDRLVQGQTNQSGAVVLFARKASGLRSMVDRRKSFRERTLRTVFDR